MRDNLDTQANSVLLDSDLSTRSAAHNFPLASTPFIGRKEELIALVTRLQDPTCRLLSILGPGGIGKTRLALQAADDLAVQFRDGAYFAPLMGVQSVDYLVPAVASAVGFSFYGKADLREQILDYVRDKNLLLVMDNFEHLLDGVYLLHDILQAAPGVKLLVTTRERLKLPEEWVLEIQGLTYPPSDRPESWTEWSAVQLFLQSAGRIHAGYVPAQSDLIAIARLCRQMEGMPLAIELAAAWIRMLSPTEIAHEIEANLNVLDSTQTGLRGRHRSLSSTFEHSWRLLTAEEQRVFRGLSVFRQGFRTDAARQVAEASLPVLASLVDQSLLRGSPTGRYEVHELMRQYGEDCLRETPDEYTAVHDHHSAYYANFLSQHEKRLRGAEQREAVLDIKADIENIRAAWLWAAENSHTSELDKGLEALWLFYELESRFQEGAEVLHQTSCSIPEDSMIYSSLLSRRAWLLITLGKYEEARNLLERSLSLAKGFGSQSEMAFSLHALAMVTLYLGDVKLAEEHIRQALDLYKAMDDHRWEYARCLYQLAFILNHHTNADREAICRMDRQAADLFREWGDQFMLTKTLVFLGWITHLLGAEEEAVDILEEGLAAAREVGHKLTISRFLDTLGMVQLFGLHNEAAARECYEQSLAMQREIGNYPGIGYTLNNLGDMAYQRGDYHEARRRYSDYLVIARRLGEPQGLVLAIGGLGDAANGLGQYQTALDQYREALQLAVEKVPSLTMALIYCGGLLFKNTGDRDHAAALLALNYHHPGSAAYMRALAAGRLKELNPPADDLMNDQAAAVAFITTHIKTLAQTFGISRKHFDGWVADLAAEPVKAQQHPELVETLSEREMDVLKLMSEGCSNPEIADRLIIGKGTVKTHTLNIYRKLGINSRTQAILRARELGLL